ncbi:MAG: hypothetical protein QOF98_2403, partial [Streptomyces sp.]|nr:hypothetical protein [Streptomyces sp.]
MSEGEAGVRYRASWPQRLLTVAPVLFLIWSSLYVNAWPWERSSGPDGQPLWFRTEAVALPVVLLLSAYMQGWWVGITLTPREAVVRNLRRRTIAWTGVAAVEVEAFGGGGRRVVLYETEGRRTPLRMPSTAFLAGDRKFDAKAAAVRDWWLAHGGADHEAVESGGTARVREPLPDRLRLRPAAIQVLVVAMLITLLA